MGESLPILRKLRHWLDRNKVFFEIFSYCLLGGVAVFVAMQADRIAGYQNAILERQIAVQEAQIRPVLTIDLQRRAVQRGEGSLTADYDYWVVVINEEPRFFDRLTASVDTYLRFLGWRQNEQIGPLLIPVKYHAFSVTGAMSGDVGLLSPSREMGGIPWSQWGDSLVIAADALGFEIGTFEMISHVVFTYVDVIGETQKTEFVVGWDKAGGWDLRLGKDVLPASRIIDMTSRATLMCTDPTSGDPALWEGFCCATLVLDPASGRYRVCGIVSPRSLSPRRLLEMAVDYVTRAGTPR